MWAEDGQVFYAGAKHASLPHVFFQTYRGYMDAGPRVIAAPVSALHWRVVLSCSQIEDR